MLMFLEIITVSSLEPRILEQQYLNIFKTYIYLKKPKTRLFFSLCEQGMQHLTAFFGTFLNMLPKIGAVIFIFLFARKRKFGNISLLNHS